MRYLISKRKAPGYLGITMLVPGGSKSPLRYIVRILTKNTFSDFSILYGIEKISLSATTLSFDIIML
jgi:hypothetical protein